MIFGIGSDLIHHARILRVQQRFSQRFPEKLLSSDELHTFQMRANPSANNLAWLAKRWAAKEAFGKALGTGIRAPVLFPNMSIFNDALGKPYFEFTPSLREWLRTQHITNVHLSLSDEHDLSLAFVVIERGE